MVATLALGASAERRMGSSPFSPTKYFGGLAEWSIAAVLKTVERL